MSDRPQTWASLGQCAPALLDDAPAFAAWLRHGRDVSVTNARKDLSARVELDLRQRTISFSRLEHDRRRDKLNVPHVCTDKCMPLPATYGRATMVAVRDEYAIRWPS